MVSVRVEGRPLTPLLPYGLGIEPFGDDFVIVEPPDSRFAGRVVLPFVASGVVQVFDLDVPSSGDFTAEDLRLLWLSGQELASWQSRRALAAGSSAFARPEMVAKAAVLADWHALKQCARLAEGLLHQWPSRLGRELRWVPVGIGGGFEDLDRTEREVARRGYFATSPAGMRIATRSARWFGRPEPIALSAAAVMGSQVVTLVTSTVSTSELATLRDLIRPIQQVALRAANPSGQSDPEPSSWPPPFLRFVAACMQVLAELEARTQGAQAIPLLDTDELFEAWLAVTVRNLVGERVPAIAVASEGAIASWEDDAITFDLRVKPSIGRQTTIAAENYRALVAQELVPDVVLSATRGDITEFAVFDAKAWVRMLPEDVLSESAKYLYGIRRVGSARVPAVTSVDLVSCAPRPNLPDVVDARIGFVHATPTTGADALGETVERVISDLRQTIEEREQEASLLS